MAKPQDIIVVSERFMEMARRCAVLSFRHAVTSDADYNVCGHDICFGCGQRAEIRSMIKHRPDCPVSIVLNAALTDVVRRPEPAQVPPSTEQGKDGDAQDFGKCNCCGEPACVVSCDGPYAGLAWCARCRDAQDARDALSAEQGKDGDAQRVLPSVTATKCQQCGKVGIPLRADNGAGVCATCGAWKGSKREPTLAERVTALEERVSLGVVDRSRWRFAGGRAVLMCPHCRKTAYLVLADIGELLCAGCGASRDDEFRPVSTKGA